MKYLKALLDKASPGPPPTAAGAIITLDEIRKIVDALDARFLGVRPTGWLPGPAEKAARHKGPN